ncbi:MAG TPA: 50S ribosomal protein L30 [Candidatus Binataceae bacterium]|nr:50S ribosomal protein L30 [Candidatus Binataceae bacterium]HVB80068.1 50S ribosomal protein L30 [Candidatus Binataceae bacterium]
MDDKIRIRLVHSPIGTKQRVRQTLKGLGLGKLGSEREIKRSAAVDGMIRRVSHLVEVKS